MSDVAEARRVHVDPKIVVEDARASYVLTLAYLVVILLLILALGSETNYSNYGDQSVLYCWWGLLFAACVFFCIIGHLLRMEKRPFMAGVFLAITRLCLFNIVDYATGYSIISTIILWGLLLVAYVLAKHQPVPGPIPPVPPPSIPEPKPVPPPPIPPPTPLLRPPLWSKDYRKLLELAKKNLWDEAIKLIEDHTLHGKLNDIPDYANYNVMHHMAYWGKTDLFISYARYFSVNKHTRNKQSVVWLALKRGHTDFAVCAIKHGALVTPHDMDRDKERKFIVRDSFISEATTAIEQEDFEEAERLLTFAIMVDPYHRESIIQKMQCLKSLDRHFEAFQLEIAVLSTEEEQTSQHALRIPHDNKLLKFYDDEKERVSHEEDYYQKRLQGNGNLFGIALKSKKPLPTFILEGKNDMVHFADFQTTFKEKQNYSHITKDEMVGSLCFLRAHDFFMRGERIKAVQCIRYAMISDPEHGLWYKSLLYMVLNPLITIPYPRVASSDTFERVTKVWPNLVIKVLEPDLKNQRTAFEREVKYLKLFENEQEHKNIITYRGHFTVEEDDQLHWHFIVMDQVPYTLDRMLQLNTLTKPDLKCVVEGLLHGLQDIHDHGLIHCNVTPSNVGIHNLTTPDGIKILDFGGAIPMNDNQPAKRIFTPEYTCPEIIKTVVTPSIDLFSAGVVIQQCLINVCSTGPVVSDNGLEQVIAKACHRDIKQRYSIAQDMLNDFMQAWNNFQNCTFTAVPITTITDLILPLISDR